MSARHDDIAREIIGALQPAVSTPVNVSVAVPIIADILRRHTCASQGAADIAAERTRQITEEGWNAVHDDRYECRELSKAAMCYVWGRADTTVHWPWPLTWFKPTDLRRNLVKAGALIAAEIDRLDRTGIDRDKR